MISLLDQDRSKWDRTLIAEGLALLDLSATGQELTEYHLEAAIAAEHALSTSMQSTNWLAIVSHYDRLMAIRSSPVIALNRAIAVAQAHGPERAIEEIHRIDNVERLTRYPFYPAALGELEQRRGNLSRAAEHFRAAAALARNPMERQFLERRFEVCKNNAAV